MFMLELVEIVHLRMLYMHLSVRMSQSGVRLEHVNIPHHHGLR